MIYSPCITYDITHPPQEGLEPRKWLSILSQHTVVFYARPLFRKWLKTFKYPRMLIISAHPVDVAPWQKRFKPQELHWKPLNQALFDSAQPDHTPYQLIVIQDQHITPQQLSMLNGLLVKGGALIMVMENVYAQWQDWQEALQEQGLLDPFPIGFHPHGAASWWPWMTGWTLPVGQLLNELACFFPGRYTLGLRFGPYWLVRCVKRDDVTLLD